jgi:hypothetical protein
MAANNRAAQQIASLLSQAGVPAAHSIEIAQRLILVASSASSEPRTYGPDDDRGSVPVQNRFRPPESPRRSAVGSAGKDGLAGVDGIAGLDGINGMDGSDGRDGADGQVDYDRINQMIQNAINNLLYGGVYRGKKDCCKDLEDIKKRLKALEDKKNQKEECMGNSLCNVLKQQAAELRKLRRKIEEIEKKLKNTVECKE